MSQLTIYVAGGWVGKEYLLKPMKCLEEHGFIVNSTWIQRESGNNHPNILSIDSQKDMEEITNADIVLAFMESPNYAYRGTYFEIGYALGQNKKVIIICPGKFKLMSKNKCNYDFYCMGLPFFWNENIIRAKTFEESLKILMSFKD